MKINNKGFTLIELMVTVAIIGILGAVAVPAYQDYTIRSQVTEGLSLASGAKVQVAEYYANHGKFPETMDDIGMVSSQGSYIKETRLDDDGKITTVFGKNANKLILDNTISLIPTENAKGNLEWSCEATIQEKYLPTSCRTYDLDSSSNEPKKTVDENGNSLVPFEHDGIIFPAGTPTILDEPVAYRVSSGFTSLWYDKEDNLIASIYREHEDHNKFSQRQVIWSCEGDNPKTTGTTWLHYGWALGSCQNNQARKLYSTGRVRFYNLDGNKDYYYPSE